MPETQPILLHGLALADRPATTLLPHHAHPHAPVVAGFERLVADVTGPSDVVAAAADGLPPGLARAEAIAVRLQRLGIETGWGEPREVPDRQALVDRVREHGASSVAVARADPSLVPELLLGRWFDAPWARRLACRAQVSAAVRLGRRAGPDTDLVVAFWRGVRAAALRREWRRLTRSSYVVLVYHRFAGELKPGQEKVDLAPDVFERQLRLLRLLRFRHLRAEELVAFHEDPDADLPARSFVLTVDDAVYDCENPLAERAALGPLLFVPAAEVGGSAHWLDGERVLGWDEVERLAGAGVTIGAHGRHHRRFSTLGDDELAAELVGARGELESKLDRPVTLVAYPNGDHDRRVRDAARQAGYQAAFTTEKGRNGAGIDPWCLRRVSVHGRDGALAVAWKAATGEALPAPWLRLRALRRRPG
jgi:hypothetical protein